MEKGKNSHVVQKLHSHALIDIQNPMHNLRGELSILMDCQCFISKVKSYLCCHQSTKRGRLKVYLGP
jgi:hypothetical protein